MSDSTLVRRWRRLLAVGLCLLVTALPSPSDQHENVLREAEKLRLEGDHAAIVQLLSPLVESNPDLAEAQRRLGLAFYRQQGFAKAIHHLSAALRLEEEGSGAWKETVEILALSYYFSDRARDAMLLFERALTWNADDSHLAYTLARTYIYVRETAKARETLARLFEIPPDGPQAFLLAGHFMVRESFMEEGGAMIRRAQELAAEGAGFRFLPEANYRLGLVALTSGRLEEAVQYLKQELAVNPSHSLAWYYLGDAYHRTNKLEEAVVALQRSIWLNPESTQPHFMLASVYFRQERFLFAENSLTRALDLSPASYEANFLLARVYLKTNRTEMARKQMEIAKQLIASEYANTDYQGMGVQQGK